MSLVRYVLNFSVWVDCVIDALNFCVRVGLCVWGGLVSSGPWAVVADGSESNPYEVC